VARMMQRHFLVYNTLSGVMSSWRPTPESGQRKTRTTLPASIGALLDAKHKVSVIIIVPSERVIERIQYTIQCHGALTDV
jgi:hypothetical protein